jgi:hypothetical protein
MRVPERLPTGPERGFRIVRRTLFVLFAIVLPLQLVALGFTYYYGEMTSRGYASVGLRFLPAQKLETALGEPVGPYSRAAGFARGDRIVAIDGKPPPSPEETFGVAAALEGDGRGAIVLTVRRPDGTLLRARLTRSDAHAARDPGYWLVGRWWLVLLAFLGACLMQFSLTGTALMLLLKRWRDPVALLFAATFLAMAAGSDRVGAFFTVMLGGWFVPAATAAWLIGLTIGLAAFPDGVFRPRRAGWLVLAAPPVALLLAARVLPPEVNPLLSLAFVGLALATQFVRFRDARGIGRQQIKWAGLGFAVGVILLGLSTLGTRTIANGWVGGGVYVWVEAAAQACYALGFAAFPLSLLVAMLRFRLWDVDRVIGRSSAFGIVTLVMGASWAGLQEVAKIGFASFSGGTDPTTVAALTTAAVAILFPPLQRRVELWTERKLQEPIARLRDLPAHWTAHGQVATPDALLARALGETLGAVSASGGDAWLCQDGAWRRVLVLGDGAAFPPLDLDADAEDGVAHRLSAEGARIRFAPRPDGSPYPRDMRRVIDSLAEPLGAALETALDRDFHRRALAGITARLAALEARAGG